MSAGYVFVLSNPLYPEFVYVGASTKSPSDRAAELYSEGLLYPFRVETAKSVSNLENKLVSLHKLLSKFGERPNPDRDFFKIPTDTLEHLFELIDGIAWLPAEATPEQNWNTLMEKVGMIMKNETPKMNEFQFNKLKMKVASILKTRNIFEPTLENVREAMDTSRKEQVNPVPV
jgi:hypothetical protein